LRRSRRRIPRTVLHLGAARRMVSLGGQLTGNLRVIGAGARQLEHARLHLAVARQRGDGVDRQCNRHFGYLTAPPDDPHLGHIPSSAAHDDLVDEAAEQGLPVLAANRWVGPDLGQPLAESNHLRAQPRIDPVGPGSGGRSPSRERLLSTAELQERRLSTPLEFGRDEPVVGVDPVELALGETGLVAETIDLLHLGAPQPCPLVGPIRVLPKTKAPA
jgi:hypothetical protein